MPHEFRDRCLNHKPVVLLLGKHSFSESFCTHVWRIDLDFYSSDLYADSFPVSGAPSAGDAPSACL